MLRHIPHLVHPPIAAQRLWPLPRTTYINFSTSMRAQCTNQNRQSDALQEGKKERRFFSFSSMQRRRRMGELSDLANRGGRSSSPYERCLSSGCRGAGPHSAATHRGGRRGGEGEPSGGGKEYPMGDHRAALRQRQRDHRAAGHHGLRQLGSHLCRGRQDAISEGGVNCLRAERIERSRRPADTRASTVNTANGPA